MRAGRRRATLMIVTATPCAPARRANARCGRLAHRFVQRSRGAVHSSTQRDTLLHEVTALGQRRKVGFALAREVLRVPIDTRRRSRTGAHKAFVVGVILHRALCQLDGSLILLIGGDCLLVAAIARIQFCFSLLLEPVLTHASGLALTCSAAALTCCDPFLLGNGVGLAGFWREVGVMPTGIVVEDVIALASSELIQHT